jgi:hypothetical protein
VLLGAAALVGLVGALHETGNDTRRRQPVCRCVRRTCSDASSSPSAGWVSWTTDFPTCAIRRPVPGIPTLIPNPEVKSWGQRVDGGDSQGLDLRVRGDNGGDGGDGEAKPHAAVEGMFVAAAPRSTTRALRSAMEVAIVAPSRTRACGGSRGPGPGKGRHTHSGQGG